MYIYTASATTLCAVHTWLSCPPWPRPCMLRKAACRTAAVEDLQSRGPAVGVNTSATCRVAGLVWALTGLSAPAHPSLLRHVGTTWRNGSTILPDSHGQRPSCPLRGYSSGGTSPGGCLAEAIATRTRGHAYKYFSLSQPVVANRQPRTGCT